MLFIIDRIGRSRILNAFLIAWACCMLSACSVTSLMFYPSQKIPVLPDQLGVRYEEVTHVAKDGVQLVSWRMFSETTPARGIIIYLHGNAQNISYHQLNVNWLPQHGYDVFLLGYREYGHSQGLAKLPDVFWDFHSALDWVLKHYDEQTPIYVLAQSMGGSIAVNGIATHTDGEKIRAVFLDGTFDSYPGMAQTALSRSWITWLFQWPASWMTKEHDPEYWITQWPPVPLMITHSPADRVVPYEKGRRLFEVASEPKQWIDNSGPHIATFRDKQMRDALLSFFARADQEIR